MTGSAAAALTGLMFVVITLIRRSEDVERAQVGVSTFSTPTVVHFCAAFLVSAVFVAPWRAPLHPAILTGLIGLCGILYAIRLVYRTKRLSGYAPDLEDWICYNVLPSVAYGVILAGGSALARFTVEGEFAVAVGVVTLIFIGIHNAWDIVTFLVVRGGSTEA
jgi:hypothetical protein